MLDIILAKLNNIQPVELNEDQLNDFKFIAQQGIANNVQWIPNGVQSIPLTTKNFTHALNLYNSQEENSSKPIRFSPVDANHPEDTKLKDLLTYLDQIKEVLNNIDEMYKEIAPHEVDADDLLTTVIAKMPQEIDIEYLEVVRTNLDCASNLFYFGKEAYALQKIYMAVEVKLEALYSIREEERCKEVVPKIVSRIEAFLDCKMEQFESLLKSHDESLLLDFQLQKTNGYTFDDTTLEELNLTRYSKDGFKNLLGDAQHINKLMSHAGLMPLIDQCMTLIDLLIPLHNKDICFTRKYEGLIPTLSAFYQFVKSKPTTWGETAYKWLTWQSNNLDDTFFKDIKALIPEIELIEPVLKNAAPEKVVPASTEKEAPTQSANAGYLPTLNLNFGGLWSRQASVANHVTPSDVTPRLSFPNQS